MGILKKSLGGEVWLNWFTKHTERSDFKPNASGKRNTCNPSLCHLGDQKFEASLGYRRLCIRQEWEEMIGKKENENHIRKRKANSEGSSVWTLV